MKIVIEKIENESQTKKRFPASFVARVVERFLDFFRRLLVVRLLVVRAENYSPARRLLAIGLVLSFAWGIITIRLLGIHFGDSEKMLARVARQQKTTEIIRARPGDILDRKGQLLATSVDTHSLFVIPKNIEDVEGISSQLGTLLDLDPEKIQQKIERHQSKGFLWIARRLDAEVADAIRESELDHQLYGFRREYKRRYPNGKLGVHLIGLRDIDGIGHGGLEQAYQKTLSGRAGERVLVRDAHNRVVHLYEKNQSPVVHGKSIQLTIDLQMQQLLEEELDKIMKLWEPKGCCAILCAPKTGEILGMSSRPTFNPEQSSTFRDDAWMNRCVAWSYEPGSTMKPLIVASAMRQQVISYDSTFNGHWGEYRMGSRRLHDSHAYGELTLAEVLIKSSNIGMAQIGERMTNRGLYEALQRFGFGFRTGSRLPGEIAGFVRPLPKWNLYSTGSIPMGQELAVTPLQMIAAHAVLSNNGAYQQPRLVLNIDHQDTQREVPGLHMELISPGICRWVVQEPMRKVMTEGTGRRVNEPSLELYGKTGTSQVYDQEAKQYSSQKTVCSFVCGVPARDPRLLVLVVVDQPTLGSGHYGGTVAGPAAVSLLQKTYPLQSLSVAGSEKEKLNR